MKKLLFVIILLQFIFLGCVSSEPLEYKVYYEDGVVHHYYFKKTPQAIAFMSIGFVRYFDHIEVLSGAENVKAIFFEVAEGPDKKRIFLKDFNIFSNIEYLHIPWFDFTEEDLTALNNFKKLRMIAFAPKAITMQTLDFRHIQNLEAIAFYFPEDWLKLNPQLYLPKALKYVEINTYPKGASHIIGTLKNIDRVVILDQEPLNKESKNYPSNFEWLYINSSKEEESPFYKMAPTFPDITKGRVQEDEE